MLNSRDKMFKSDDETQRYITYKEAGVQEAVRQLDRLAMRIIEGEVDVVGLDFRLTDQSNRHPRGFGSGPNRVLEVEYNED